MSPAKSKYTKNCMVPKVKYNERKNIITMIIIIIIIIIYISQEGHVGQFPANFCVKLVGTNGQIIVISSI